MKPEEYSTAYSTTIDDHASLQQFYLFTDHLSSNRRVRFTGKLDEAEIIEWHFKYRGYPLTLQYDIYNGISLSQPGAKDLRAMNEVAVILKSKKRQ